ncbi:hypothetical protein VTN00DRAFT_2276 [Thermoascus crustaceus]|uniref:uncharacterized protein n=1 Tax=Thermoascus crustaceus TaxID=5088 RepID=UPI003742AF19
MFVTKPIETPIRPDHYPNLPGILENLPIHFAGGNLKPPYSATHNQRTIEMIQTSIGGSVRLVSLTGYWLGCQAAASAKRLQSILLDVDALNEDEFMIIRIVEDKNFALRRQTDIIGIIQMRNTMIKQMQTEQTSG